MSSGCSFVGDNFDQRKPGAMYTLILSADSLGHGSKCVAGSPHIFTNAIANVDGRVFNNADAA